MICFDFLVFQCSNTQQPLNRFFVSRKSACLSAESPRPNIPSQWVNKFHPTQPPTPLRQHHGYRIEEPNSLSDKRAFDRYCLFSQSLQDAPPIRPHRRLRRLPFRPHRLLLLPVRGHRRTHNEIKGVRATWSKWGDLEPWNRRQARTVNRKIKYRTHARCRANTGCAQFYFGSESTSSLSVLTLHWIRRTTVKGRSS